LRTVATPFTVTPPSGARIRDRLRLSSADERALMLIGEHLGRHARADLAGRVRMGVVPVKENQRAGRKKALTGVSSSRWAGAITRAAEDQYRLSMRCLREERTSQRRAARTIRARLEVACGQRRGRVRGYADRGERWQKQRRLAILDGRLIEVERRVDDGRPAIVVGGWRLANTRHNLDQAGLTETEWRQRWDAARWFLTADGETGAPYGNYTITVTPGGQVTIALPEPLRHLANAARGRYQLDSTVSFHHRRDEWLDRVEAHRAVRYDVTFDPSRGRWYLDASWTTGNTTLPALADLAEGGARLLGVDLNADHLAACVVDAHGNPVGTPRTVALQLTGPAATRDGRLRAAITHLIHLAKQHDCAGIAIENLGFADARHTGRETMGRGRRGKAFRRTVHGIPTARFRERLRGMAYHAGLLVVAVDAAYTSRWGAQHWRTPLQQQDSTATGHHAAAVAIARRAHGHGIRRRPGVPVHHQSDGARRATGQAAPRPRARGTTTPSRTTGRPHRGGKTRPGRGGQLAVPDPHHRSEGHQTPRLACGSSANPGQDH
jgi:hypothetical protein